MPSIDCILTRARLRYAVRLARSDQHVLRSLVWNTGVPTKWARQIQRDILLLRVHCAREGDLDAAWHWMTSAPIEETNQATEQIFWDSSVADPEIPIAPTDGRCSETAVEPSAGLPVLTCSFCVSSNKQFLSLKAPQSHQRVVHNILSPMRAYADSDGTCPVCKTCFRTRLRLLAHLCDSRRPRCRDACFGSDITPLCEERVKELDELDRGARRAARRSGHTHPLAVGAATRADGTAIGRAVG